jgi:hypothetical protein
LEAILGLVGAGGRSRRSPGVETLGRPWPIRCIVTVRRPAWKRWIDLPELNVAIFAFLLNLAWEKACKAAGLPVLRPYETFRRSTATEWMRRGASEREVQELLCHRTRHATPRYARLADEWLESIGERRRGDHGRNSRWLADGT